MVTAAAAIGRYDVLPEAELERLYVRVGRRRPGVVGRRVGGCGRYLVDAGGRAPACAGGEQPEHGQRRGQGERARGAREGAQGEAVGDGTVHGGAPLTTRAGGSGKLEHLLEVISPALKALLDRGHRRHVGGAGRCAEAHRLEDLGHLTLREGIARLELLAE